MRVARRLPVLNPKNFELPERHDPRQSGLKYGLKLEDIKPPPTYDHISVPTANRLPTFPRVPADTSLHKKNFKNLTDIIGVEQDPVKNSLKHGQWGIVALNGGYIKFQHFEYMRNIANHNIKKHLFGEYRIPSPWKAITKKNQGTKMGGGKAEISYYVTPVKKFNVILEIGGKTEYSQIKTWIETIAANLPVKAQVVTHDELEEMKAEYFKQEGRSNPFTVKNVIDYNIGGFRTSRFGRLQIKHYLEFS